ncbi:MAG: DedA family protein [Proteobacteria bacterium]|nr:DedA family protein [Pseudomonadota bacterium]
MESLIFEYGLTAIFISMMLNGFLSAPPSELVLPLAGLLALTTDIPILHTLLAAIVGNLLGTYLLYLVGKLLGYDWLIRFRRFLLSGHGMGRRAGAFIPNELMLDKVGRLLREKGAWILCVSRCLPYVRSIVSLPAGMIGVSHSVFIIYSLVGIAIWTLFWQLGAYLLGYSWMNYSKTITIIMLLVAAVLFVCFKRKVAKCVEVYLEQNNAQ